MSVEIYQLVESPEPLNPYGVKRFAKSGEGLPVLCFIDGPCCKVRFGMEA